MYGPSDLIGYDILTYMAESVVLGILVDHYYDADSIELAMIIAKSQGWTFIGIPVDVEFEGVRLH